MIFRGTLPLRTQVHSCTHHGHTRHETHRLCLRKQDRRYDLDRHILPIHRYIYRHRFHKFRCWYNYSHMRLHFHKHHRTSLARIGNRVVHCRYLFGWSHRCHGRETNTFGLSRLVDIDVVRKFHTKIQTNRS